MKKSVILFCLVFPAAFSLFSQMKETPLEHYYAMENKSDFRATFLRDFKYVEYVNCGVTGQCLHVKVPADHPHKGFAVHTGKRQYAFFPGVVTISAKFKGKGRCTLGFILYNRMYRIYWITKAPFASSKGMVIDSPNAWVEKKFTFKPAMGDVKEITGFLPYSVVSAGSDVYIDDVRTRIIPHPDKAAFVKNFPHISEAQARAEWKAKKALKQKSKSKTK